MSSVPLSNRDIVVESPASPKGENAIVYVNEGALTVRQFRLVQRFG